MMPITLHLFLMILTMFVGFFVGAFLGWEWKNDLGAADWSSWIVFLALPFVGLFGAIPLFSLIPVRCPGCGWPVAFLWPGETWIYRCLSCRHVHCTCWPGRESDYGPYRSKMRLSQFPLDESSVYRVTFSGHVYRPSTLVVRIRPAPPPDVESELTTQLEARVTHEQGATLAHAAGTVKQWESKRISYPWRADLELWHPDWKDVPLHGTGNFTLEFSLSEVHLQGRSLMIRPALEFLQFSG
jgi:hypothetical protein